MQDIPKSTCDLPILVVDDDDDILRMTSFVLRQLGYAVKTASDGASGIATLEAEGKPPCLILLDLMMPVMDGAEFRNRMRTIPWAVDVPVVILSGDNELATKAAEMNVAGFEQKPISVERLAAVAVKYCRAAS
jgi:CheY-like chemotaxis protein